MIRGRLQARGKCRCCIYIFDKVLGGRAPNDPESKCEISRDESILEDNSDKAKKEVEKEVYRDYPSKKPKKVRDMEYQDIK